MMGAPRRAVWLLCGALALGALTAGWLTEARAETRRQTRESIGLEAGDRPPPFSATDLNGHAQTLSQYRGQVVVLHFWASWCPYCRGEIPKLKQVHAQGSSNGVAVVAVSVDDDVDALQRFLASSALGYPVIADADTDPSLADQYDISGIPVTYIVMRDGHIASKLEGSSDIAGAVQQALALSPST